MSLLKFTIPPDNEGYSFTDANEVLAVQLDGGAAKYRKDILNSNLRLNVQWTLNKDTYNLIRVFYKNILISGSLPFLIDLYIDDPYALTEHECYFVPGTFGLRNQLGERFVVGATLDVKPVELKQENIDTAFMFLLFGEEWLFYENSFNELMNVQFLSLLEIQ